MKRYQSQGITNFFPSSRFQDVTHHRLKTPHLNLLHHPPSPWEGGGTGSVLSLFSQSPLSLVSFLHLLLCLAHVERIPGFQPKCFRGSHTETPPALFYLIFFMFSTCPSALPPSVSSLVPRLLFLFPLSGDSSWLPVLSGRPFVLKPRSGGFIPQQSLSSTRERVAVGRWWMGGLSGWPVGRWLWPVGGFGSFSGARARFRVVKTGHSSIAAWSQVELPRQWTPPSAPPHPPPLSTPPPSTLSTCLSTPANYKFATFTCSKSPMS